MREIDAIYLDDPSYGSRSITAVLANSGWTVNRKRVQRLMRLMNIAGVTPKRIDVEAVAGSSDLPVFAAQRGDCASGPGVEHRHHLRADAERLRVSDGRDGLVQPLRAELAVVESTGGELLHRGAGRGVVARSAGGVQHRPGDAVHQRGVRESAAWIARWR